MKLNVGEDTPHGGSPFGQGGSLSVSKTLFCGSHANAISLGIANLQLYKKGRSRNEDAISEMTQENIRWIQRFQNFENAIHYLKVPLDISQPTIIEKAGLIQFF